MIFIYLFILITYYMDCVMLIVFFYHITLLLHVDLYYENYIYIFIFLVNIYIYICLYVKIHISFVKCENNFRRF